MTRKASSILKAAEKSVYGALNPRASLYLFILQTLGSQPMTGVELRRKCRSTLPSCRGLSKILKEMIGQGYVQRSGNTGYVLTEAGSEIGRAMKGFKLSLKKFIDEALREEITEERLLSELMASVASTISLSFLGSDQIDSPIGLPLHGYISMIIASVLSNTYPYSRSLRDALKEAELLLLGQE